MTTTINLLPWRELKREQEKKLFIAMLIGAVVAALFVVLLFNYYAKSLISNQEERNNRLNTEITKLNRQIKDIKNLRLIREALISRMMIVQNLQSTRTLTVHLFDELVLIMPSGIYVTKVERKNNIVTVWGFSESNTLISNLMRNIEKDKWIHNPHLTEIKRAKDETLKENEFRLSFILKQDEQADPGKL
jgi:type IV pilus assembly protein PilN